MSTSITIAPAYEQMDAPTLKEEIRSENTKARSAARKSLEHVRACGEMLIALKAKVPHGIFQYELKDLKIERRTASNYMRVATEWETVSHLNHGVKDALKLLNRADSPPSTSSSPAPAPAPAPPRPSPLIIDAEIMEPEPQHGRIKESCWDIARQFIGELKDHRAWEERSAICDVMQVCKDRIAELDKLNGREKP